MGARVLLVTAGLLCAVLATACSSSESSAPTAPSPTASSTSAAGTTAVPTTSPETSVRLLAGTPMVECTVASKPVASVTAPALCGTLDVPEDRSNPTGRQIRLRVAVGEPVVATLELVAPGAHQALLDPATAGRIPFAVHLAHEGQWAQVTQALQRADAVARAARCAALPKGVVPDDDAAPVVTDVPILWLTADGDPQDPPANLTSNPSQQPNARIAVMPAQQHTVGHTGCAPQVIGEFVDAGTAAGLDASCIEEAKVPGLAFLLP